MTVTIYSHFEAETGLLTTRLDGSVQRADVAVWIDGLDAALAQIPDGGEFKLLVDLTGYEPADLGTQKAMRVVIPQTAAAYGLRSALLDLYPEAEITLTKTRAITCTALANVHHDSDKMTEYARLLDRERQRFFTGAAVARVWLLGLLQDNAESPHSD
jgi:hypothetical protein